MEGGKFNVRVAKFITVRWRLTGKGFFCPKCKVLNLKTSELVTIRCFVKFRLKEISSRGSRFQGAKSLDIWYFLQHVGLDSCFGFPCVIQN